MSKKELAEIVVPSVLGGLSMAVALITWFFPRRKRGEVFNPYGNPIHVPPTPPAYGAHRLSFFPPRGELSLQEWKSRYLISTSKETKFLTFLSSYGPDGVPLRELIMLAALRLSGGRSKNYWSENGEVDSLQIATHIQKSRNHSFLVDDFMEEMSESLHIELLQARLESLGLIKVRYPNGILANAALQYWHTDQRIWSIREDVWGGVLEPTVLQGLLDVFMAIPGKDVSPAAQRQREFYYHHAHLLICRIMPFRDRLRDDYDSLLKIVHVTLELLTHRFQEGDEALLKFVREIPRNYFDSQIDLMLLWAELKEKAFGKDYDGLCWVRDRLLDLVTSNEAPFRATNPRRNGLLGFLLVDLMNTAKAAHFEDIVSDAFKAGTKWVDRIPVMRSTMEETALCEALATFEIDDWNKAIPPEYHVFYGYLLSRAGLLLQGDRLLASGLQHTAKRYTTLWFYEIERVSNALKLGQQKEAAQMLASIRDRALYKRDSISCPNLWKQSGECAEIFVLLYLYEADCSASIGRLNDACAKLNSGITITSFMHDPYIQTLRVTLEMRLLEVRMWQQNLKEALPVALDLASELFDHRTRWIFAPDTIYGIVQQLLDLSNTLLSTGDAAASLKLLELVTSVRAYLPGVLSEELEPYVQQRVVTMRRFREESELSRPESNMRTLDTAIEDPITPPQTELKYDSITSRKEKSIIRMNAFLDRPPSDKVRPSGPKHLQRLARRKMERYGAPAKADTLGKLLRAPCPPTTEPGTSVTGSEKKESQKATLQTESGPNTAV